MCMIYMYTCLEYTSKLCSAGVTVLSKPQLHVTHNYVFLCAKQELNSGSKIPGHTYSTYTGVT